MVRRAALRLAEAGQIDILRKGRRIAPEAAKGVIRLRLAGPPGAGTRPEPPPPADPQELESPVRGKSLPAMARLDHESGDLCATAGRGA